jgi:hypothetical protein
MDAGTQLRDELEAIGVAYTVDRDGDFAVSRGNSVTFVRPLEQDGLSLIRIWAITNVGLELGDELTAFLLRENVDTGLGGFEADDSGKVAFSHTLLGGRDILQRHELEAALECVAAAADRYNDQIKARFGGNLFGEP